MASIETLDVQEELQNYLTSKKVNALFISIIEVLLLEKPDNPIKFIIEYLKQECKYSNCNQTNNFKRNLLLIFLLWIIDPDQSGDGPSVGGNIDLTGTKLSHLDIDSDASDTDEDEEEMDDLGDLAEIINKPTIKNRRVSVCAEVHRGDEVEVSNFVPPTYDKTEEEQEGIRKILSSCFLFRGVSPEQLDVLVNAFFPEKKLDGTVLIEQGDINAEHFFLLDQGLCEVHKDDNIVTTYKEGDFFGELALLYQAPRAATVKANGEVRVWKLDRTTFKHILESTAIQIRNKYLGFLHNVPILKSMDEVELCTVADALVPQRYNDGDVIIRQGDAGDKFFIVEKGTVSVSQQGATDLEPQELTRLGSGSYFGEIALLTSKPRQASVTAVGQVTCITIQRRVFKRVMGPLQEVLKRNLLLYNTFMGQHI
eukprot:g2745.t1